MTPELEQSDCAVEEVRLTWRESKPIFPLLLRGDGLPLVIDIQHIDVTGGIMPPDDFVGSRRRAPRASGRAGGVSGARTVYLATYLLTV